jgi:hypothetical protein
MTVPQSMEKGFAVGKILVGEYIENINSGQKEKAPESNDGSGFCHEKDFLLSGKN